MDNDHETRLYGQPDGQPHTDDHAAQLDRLADLTAQADPPGPIDQYGYSPTEARPADPAGPQDAYGPTSPEYGHDC